MTRLYNIDVMILPVCSNYMIGINEAIWAIEKVNLKIVIPCHYATISVLNTNVDEFKQKTEL